MTPYRLTNLINMEKLIAELKAKSLYIESLNRYLFFSWDLFASSKKYGITLDAHALIDNKRNLNEVIKLIYLCMIKYAETAKILELKYEPPLGIKEIEAWSSLKPDEVTKAMQYITSQLIDNNKKKVLPSQPKLPNENFKNRPLLNRIYQKWNLFWHGTVKKDFSKYD